MGASMEGEEMKYLKNILIWLDQGLNVLFAGSPDETLSARAHRGQHKKHWMIIRDGIDFIFWIFGVEDHCRKSYESEMIRKQLPREYQ